MKVRIPDSVLLILGLLVCLLLTLIVFGLPIGPSLLLLVQGALSDKFAISRTVVKATPLLLTGLGVVVAWRSGMYNIGGEGQFILGALSGAWIAKLVVFGPWHLGGLPALAMILLGSIAGGSLCGLLAGWIYTRRGVDVVISTILLNFIALQILGWAVSHPLQEAAHSLPQTDLLPATTMLPRWDRQLDAHFGVVIALVVAVLVYLLLFRNRLGYRMRLVGLNPRVAVVNGISPAQTQQIAMAISGALCGLAGGIEYTSIAGQIGTSFSQNWGFLAIPVALLGGLHPLGTVGSAAYFGALFAGSEQLGRFTQGGSTLIYVIQAVAVLAYSWLRQSAESRRLREAPAD